MFFRTFVKFTLLVVLITLTTSALAAVEVIPGTAPERQGVRLVTNMKSGTGSIQLTYQAPTQIYVSKNESGVSLEVEGTVSGNAPGAPLLPGQTYWLLLPETADPDTVVISVENPVWEALPSVYSLSPAPPAVTFRDGATITAWGDAESRILNGRDSAIYGQNTFFPAVPASEASRGTYRGCQMLQIKISPVRYKPLDGVVEVLTGGVIKVAYTESKASGSGLADLPALAKNFGAQILNIEDGTGYYTQTAAKALQSDYVVMTTGWINTNSTALASFVTHKESMGYAVTVVTEGASEDDSHYAGGTSTTTRAEGIRTWLKNRYLSWGIKYLLLVGNPHTSTFDTNTSIPMLMAYPRPGQFLDAVSPTDFYYSDLSGNWDMDGDSKPGEWTQDFAAGGVDRIYDVAVGRIPYYGVLGDLDKILQKMVSYESPSGDQSWRSKVMIPAAVSNFAPEDHNNDGDTSDSGEFVDTSKRSFAADWGESVKGLATGAGLTPTTIYEQEGVYSDGSAYSLTPSDLALTNMNVLTEWQTGYGFVTWWGHGSQTASYRRIWLSDATFPNVTQYPEETDDIEFFNDSNALQLDDSKPSLIVQVSCSNGTPENSSNLGYAILKNGAVATVSASRVSWYVVGAWNNTKMNTVGDNASYAYHVFDLMANQGYCMGDALAHCKGFFGMNWTGGESWMNATDFNLYGDPSVRYIATPTVPLVNSPSSLSFSGVTGGPFTPSEATVSLRNMSDHTINWSATAGDSWLHVVPASGPLAAGENLLLSVTVGPEADALPGGNVSSTLTVNNLTDTLTQDVDVSLSVSSVGTLPFNEEFESGFGAFWSVTGTNNYRSQLTASYSPHGGANHLLMDDSINDSTESINECTLAVNLQNYTNRQLIFWAKELGDEDNSLTSTHFLDRASFDGVAVSDDGRNWFLAQALYGISIATYTRFTVDLESLFTAKGLAPDGTFFVRFNQTDTGPSPNDGITIDDIIINGDPLGLRPVLSTTFGELTAVAPVQVYVNFGGVATGFDASDVTVSGATVASVNTSDNQHYTISLDPAGDGEIVVSVKNEAADDVMFMPTRPSTALSFTYDSSRPIASITSSAPNATNVSPIPVSVTFDEPVWGMELPDLQATNATVSALTRVDALHYTLLLIPSTQGQVSLGLIANAVQDEVGNISNVSSGFTRTYDTTKPTIALLGDNPLELEVGDTFNDPGATATDPPSTDLTSAISVDSSALHLDQPGSYSVVYQVLDAAGNAADPVTRTVHVSDNTLPVITVLGANPYQVEAKSVYTDPGAQASDNYDGDISSSVVVGLAGLNMNLIGDYLVTYNVSDSSDNDAVQKTRQVLVRDTVDPVLTLLGGTELDIEVNSVFTEPGYVAIDAYDGDLHDSVNIVGSVDTLLVAEYTLTYSVSDASGNAPADQVRTIRVINTPPVVSSLSISPANPVTTDDLQTTVDADDPSGDPIVATEYRWYRDDTLMDVIGNTAVLPAAATSRGEVWKAQARASDPSGWGAWVSSQSVTIVNSMPQIASIGPQTQGEGQTVVFTLVGNDPDQSDVLSYRSVSIPNGATFNPETREFTWTPGFDQAGDYTLTFEIADNALPPLTATRDVAVTISDVNRPPVLAPIGNQEIEVLQILQFTVTAIDQDSADTLTYSVDGLPSGASFDSISRVFSWTPGQTEDGTYQVVFRVSDNGVGSLNDDEMVTIIVNPLPEEGQSEGQPTEGQALEGQPSEGQPLEGSPVEGQPLEGAPAEGQPAEGQPLEGSPAEGQPLEGSPVEGQPLEGSPAEGQPLEGEPLEGVIPEGAPPEGLPVEGEAQEGEVLPRIWFVDKASGSGASADGLSWSTAYASLQNGIDAAFAAGGGDVWVAESPYSEARTADASGALIVRSGVRVLGGFIGVETTEQQRKPSIYDVLISGERARGGQPAYHVVVFEDNATLDGVTVSGGSASGTGTAAHGGGLFASDVDSVLLRNIKVIGNTAADLGAGLYSDGSTITVEDCVFQQGDANEGGGICAVNASSLQIVNTQFIENVAALGGAIRARDGALEIDSSIFDSNRADSGGALYVNTQSLVSLENVTLERNEAGTGGAVYASSVGALLLRGSFLDLNSATQQHGGALLLLSSNTTIERTALANNAASSSGGCIYAEAGTLSLLNVLAHHNDANAGGAIWASAPSVTIQFSTIADNSAVTGGALHAVSGTASIANSILAGNLGVALFESNSAANIVPSYCDFFDNPDGHFRDAVSETTLTAVTGSLGVNGQVPGATDNIDGDPLFLALDDYHLGSGSACIDKAFAGGAPIVDLGGQTRPVGIGFDIGALEHNPASEGQMEGELEGQISEGIPVEGEAPAYLDISVQDAHTLWAQDIYFLDVRTSLEFCQGHIPGAVNISSTGLAGRIGELAGHEHSILVVYCASGSRSRTASSLLSQNGFTQIRNMLGGFSSWKTQGFESSQAGCEGEGEPAEGAPVEGNPPLEGEPLLEGETPVEGDNPVEGADIEGTPPLEGNLPSDGDAPEGNPPVQGTVMGTVKDFNTGTVLQGATLEVTPGDRTTITDAQGGFAISSLVPDDYFISANMPGYKPAIVAFTIEDSGQVQRIDFRLQLLSAPEGDSEGQNPSEGAIPSDGETVVAEGDTDTTGGNEGAAVDTNTPAASSGCFGG